MDLVNRLAAAHETLAKARGLTLAPTEVTDEERADGAASWPLRDDDLADLEEIAGFSFSPTLRALLTTPNALPEGEGFGIYRVSEWSGSSILERNRQVAEAREECDWDLPKMLVLSHDEDFRAVQEDGTVVEVCGNEGNVEATFGPLEAWIDRYTDGILAYAEAVVAAKDDSYAVREAFQDDPETEYL
jgi:hypothetical protein